MSRTTSLQSLEGYGLTTAHILYRMPDYRELLQTYVWQEFDTMPHYPELAKFLDFWEKKLEGPLHSVVVSHRLILPSHEVVRLARHEILLQ